MFVKIQDPAAADSKRGYMSDIEVKEEQSGQADETLIFETVGGRKFDLKTAEGRAGLKAFQDALSFTAGKLSNEVGSLRKAQAPFQKLGLKVETTDEAQLAVTAKKLVEEGKLEDAFGLMFSELQNSRRKLEQERQENQFWSEYTKLRSDLFSVFPEDVAKTYVFANYREKLYEVEDPYALVDSILEPKVSRLKAPQPKVEPVVEVPASLGAGKIAAPVQKPSKDAEQEAKARALMEKAMGIKS